MDIIAQLVDKGYDVMISNQVRRMEDPNPGMGDDLVNVGRVFWSIDKYNEITVKCEWEGFATAKEAMNDLTEKTKHLL